MNLKKMEKLEAQIKKLQETIAVKSKDFKTPKDQEKDPKFRALKKKLKRKCVNSSCSFSLVFLFSLSLSCLAFLHTSVKHV